MNRLWYLYLFIISDILFTTFHLLRIFIYLLRITIFHRPTYLIKVKKNIMNNLSIFSKFFLRFLKQQFILSVTKRYLNFTKTYVNGKMFKIIFKRRNSRFTFIIAALIFDKTCFLHILFDLMFP